MTKKLCAAAAVAFASLALFVGVAHADDDSRDYSSDHATQSSDTGDNADDSDSDSGSDAEQTPAYGGKGGPEGENYVRCGSGLGLRMGSNNCDEAPAHRGADGPDRLLF